MSHVIYGCGGFVNAITDATLPVSIKSQKINDMIA